jgi:hypothetical protein
MASIINATTTNGLSTSADNSGSLQLATNNGTTAVTIDTSQKVLIGTTTSPSATGALLTVSGASAAYTEYNKGTDGGGVVGSEGTGLVFYTYTGNIGSETYTERMRINSGGNLLVGTTSAISSGFTTISYNGTALNGVIISESAGTSGTAFLGFNSGATNIGSVSRVGLTNAVVYSTTSDQRLKSNIADANPVLDKLMTVKVRQFDWTEGDLHQDAGFIAQELAPVLSGIVTEGKTEEDMWQMDYSRLTPYLVKAVQELNAKVEAQAVRIAELEGAK